MFIDLGDQQFMPELAEQFFCEVTRCIHSAAGLGWSFQESFTPVSGSLEEVARGWTQLCTSPYTGFLHGLVAMACKWSQLQEGVFQEQKVEAANPLRSESVNRVNCFCLLGLVKKVVESAKISREGNIDLSLRRSVSHPSYVVTFVYLFIFCSVMILVERRGAPFRDLVKKHYVIHNCPLETLSIQIVV